MSWREVKGYRYQHRVSDMGVLQRLRSDGTWKTVKAMLHGPRVEVYMVTPDGKCPTRILARIVYEAFHGSIPPGHNVIHKNGLKADCSIYNLVAVPQNVRISKPGNRRAVMKIDRDGNVVEIYKSTVEAAKKNHISQAAIGKRCLGLIKDPYRLDGYNYVYEERRRRKYG